MPYIRKTKEEWLKFAEENKEKLAWLIKDYHPVNRQPGTRRASVLHRGDYITAPNAEAACVQVRNKIRQNFEGNPVQQFEEALRQKDVSKINKLLNDTWFGVPESTSCWNILGFKEAVELMEDIPDDDNDGEAA